MQSGVTPVSVSELNLIFKRLQNCRCTRYSGSLRFSQSREIRRSFRWISGCLRARWEHSFYWNNLFWKIYLFRSQFSSIFWKSRNGQWPTLWLFETVSISLRRHQFLLTFPVRFACSIQTSVLCIPIIAFFSNDGWNEWFDDILPATFEYLQFCYDKFDDWHSVHWHWCSYQAETARTASCYGE